MANSLNKITTKSILDATVATADIAADAITGAKIADDAIGAEHIERLDAALQLGDSVKAQIGASDDLELYHNGSHSYIDNSQGNLLIRNNVDSDTGGNIHLKPHDDEQGIIITHDAGVELYYDNVKKLETTSSGANVSGVSTNTGLDYAASQILKVSNSSDTNNVHSALSFPFGSQDRGPAIYAAYRGTSGEGDLILAPDYAEQAAVFKPHGAVELYYDNSKTLETVSGGAKVTGKLEVNGDVQWDGSDGSWGVYWDKSANGGSVKDDAYIGFGTGNDLKIYHDGSHNYIEGASHEIRIRSDDIRFRNAANNKTMLYAHDDGAVELYYDNTKMLQTSSSGVDVTLDSSDTSGTPDKSLLIYNSNDGGNTMAGIRFVAASAANTDHWIYQKKHSSGNGTDLIIAHGSSERLRFIETGGFTFNGDTAAANALDDYEEGYWTPVASGGDSGSQALDSSCNQGSYTKIGRIVHIGGRLRIGGSSIDASGIMRFTLPFTNASLDDEADLYQMAINTHGISLAGTHQTTFGEFDGNSDKFILVHQRDNASWAAVNWSDCAVGDYITFMGSFIAA